MITVHEILEKARASGHRLPYNEAAVLYAAAVRIAAAHGATVRGHLVKIDDAGGLHVDDFDEQAPESEPGYLAPELLAADAPPKSDPHVQVYAAGALGYELLTGKLAPQPGVAPGPELSGALGDVVRLALSPDRRARYGDLKQLYDAVEVVQPRPPPEGERNILSALRTRLSRPPPEKEALAKLIEKLHHLEAQVAQLAKAHTRLETSQQQAMEMLDRFDDGQRRTQELHKPRSSVAPAIFAGLLASVAVLAAAWALGMVATPVVSGSKIAQIVTPTPSAPESEATAPRQAEPVTNHTEPAGAPARSAQINSADTAADASAIATADAAVAAAAGEVDAAVASTPTPDAGQPEAVAAAPAPPAAAPPLAPRTPPSKPPAKNSKTAMQHALAVSQVRRGEASLEQGRADDALSSFRAALENEPSMATAFRGMGMAYAVLGHDAEALQAYDKYLRLAPAAADAAEIRKSIRELKARAKVGAKEQ